MSYCISNMNRYMCREMFVEDVNIEKESLLSCYRLTSKEMRNPLNETNSEG